MESGEAVYVRYMSELDLLKQIQPRSKMRIREHSGFDNDINVMIGSGAFTYACEVLHH